MENTKKSYETMFIVDLSAGEEAAKPVVEKFVNLISENAENVQVNEWGKRRFAYPINDKNDGYYVLVTFDAATAFPAELTRVYNITEGIMRSIVVRIGE